MCAPGILRDILLEGALRLQAGALELNLLWVLYD